MSDFLFIGYLIDLLSIKYLSLVSVVIDMEGRLFVSGFEFLEAWHVGSLFMIRITFSWKNSQVFILVQFPALFKASDL